VQAIASAYQDTGPAADYYPRFHAAVALAQLNNWLPSASRLLVDISGPGSRAAELAAYAGHHVLRVIDAVSPPGDSLPAWGAPAPHPPRPPVTPRYGGQTSRMGGSRPPFPPAPEGRLATVAADGAGLEFLADGCADGVIAEDRALSHRLAAEDVVAEIARVLRPGGQVLACVDSLMFGMAVLAEQHRWPHLVDVPNADVVLIPWPDGTITRCYGAEQLRELFTGGGLEVSWIRPRTVFSPRTVSYLLARDPGRFDELVNAELQAHADDSVGTQLIACAVLPPGDGPPVTPRYGGPAPHSPRGPAR
jgi:SAM-dependent methyltransferase